MRRIHYDLPDMGDKCGWHFGGVLPRGMGTEATLDKLHLSKPDREAVERALNDLGTAEMPLEGGNKKP